MIELDGPPRAWFESPEGNFVYFVYAYAAKTPKECFDAYINWYKNQKSEAIIWRRRPFLSEELNEYNPDGSIKIDSLPYWKLTWRCATIDSVDASETARIIPEGSFVVRKDYL